MEGKLTQPTFKTREFREALVGHIRRQEEGVTTIVITATIGEDGLPRTAVLTDIPADCPDLWPLTKAVLERALEVQIKPLIAFGA